MFSVWHLFFSLELKVVLKKRNQVIYSSDIFTCRFTYNPEAGTAPVVSKTQSNIQIINGLDLEEYQLSLGELYFEVKPGACPFCS